MSSQMPLPARFPEFVGCRLKEIVELSGGAIRPDFTNWIGMMLVWIKPGTFMMGSPANEQGRNSDEGPAHRVSITKGLLESNGIPCLLKSRMAPALHAYTFGSIGEFGVMVRESMAEKAKRLIRGEDYA